MQDAQTRDVYVVSANASPNAGAFCAASHDLACAVTAYWLMLGSYLDTRSIDLDTLCPEWTDEQKANWDGLIPYRYSADGSLDFDSVLEWLYAIPAKPDISVSGSLTSDYFAIEAFLMPADSAETYILLTKTPCIDSQAKMAAWMRARV